MARSSLARCLWLGLAAAGAAQTAVDIEFCDKRGTCEVVKADDALPAKFCTEAADRPPALVWPFFRLRFRLVTAGAIEQAPPVISWNAPPKVARPILRYTARTRGLCQWTGPGVLCPDCSTGSCPLRATGVLGLPDVYDATLPPQGGCIYVHGLPTGVQRARASWEATVDPLVPVYALAGMVLLAYWQTLRESATLHAAIGGVGSFVFISLMLAWWLFREMRGTVQGAVPFGRSLTTVSMLLFAFLPAARDTVISMVVPNGGWDWKAWLNVKDPFWNLPVGWIFVAVAASTAAGAVLLGARLSVRYFATAPDPEGPVGFAIGPDGRRVDELPPRPWTQTFLGWLLWSAGAGLLLCSTHLQEVSLTLLLLALLVGPVLHYLRQRCQALAAVSPGSLRPLISPAAYAEQSRRSTDRATAELRALLQVNPALLRHVKEESELRLRRFSDGGAHFQPPADLLADDPRRACCVM